MKAAPLLRRWVRRLRELGIRFELHHRWDRSDSFGWRSAKTIVQHGCNRSAHSRCGRGHSRARRWVVAGNRFGRSMVPNPTEPWRPSDSAAAGKLRLGGRLACGCPCSRGRQTAEECAGARGAPNSAIGELLVTHYGLEGGAIYQLAPALRTMPKPEITIDFKPDSTSDQLLAKLGRAAAPTAPRGTASLAL
jgi:hypothetical protein